jgi:leucyl-tRNA---protein transferase
MIYYQVDSLESLAPQLLDEYLAAGWYRMQQLIFTTDLILKDNQLLPVFWLRVVIKKYTLAKKNEKIIGRNKKYTVTCEAAVITEELEELYELYKSAMNFELAESIQDSLLGEAGNSIYNTRCYTIRDGEKLIAAGFFDVGENSIAGILNIYHPDYARNQLGKYLVLLKAEYARQQQKEYYYSGYICTADSKFDYKLFVSKEATEVYNRKEQRWVPWLSVEKAQLIEWLIENENTTLI